MHHNQHPKVMDKLKFLILGVVFAFSCNIVMADSSSSGNTSEKATTKKTVLYASPTGSLRPNAPSRLSMECSYGEEFIEFLLPEGVESLFIRVYDSLFELDGMVTCSNPRFETPNLQGEYSIECITEDGRVFFGIIVF